MVNECSSLSTGMPASVVVGGVGCVSVMSAFRWGLLFGIYWAGVSGNSSHCTAPPSDSQRCSAIGASDGSVAPRSPLPSGWSGVDESLALAAVITTLCACVRGRCMAVP